MASVILSPLWHDRRIETNLTVSQFKTVKNYLSNTKGQEASLVRVYFLCSINLPYGEGRDGELERNDLHFFSLAALQFPRC